MTALCTVWERWKQDNKSGFSATVRGRSLRSPGTRSCAPTGRAMFTFVWFTTIQFSQTFTRCSKQNCVVTCRLGHLHRPIAFAGLCVRCRPAVCFPLANALLSLDFRATLLSAVYRPRLVQFLLRIRSRAPTPHDDSPIASKPK